MEPGLPQEARRYADEWLFPTGANANVENYQQCVHFDPDVTEEERTLLADPQTSGGLLLCVPRPKRTEFEQRMVNSSVSYRIIGEVLEGSVIDVQRRSCQDST